jgi:hypothetical protein
VLLIEIKLMTRTLDRPQPAANNEKNLLCNSYVWTPSLTIFSAKTPIQPLNVPKLNTKSFSKFSPQDQILNIELA